MGEYDGNEWKGAFLELPLDFYTDRSNENPKLSSDVLKAFNNAMEHTQYAGCTIDYVDNIYEAYDPFSDCAFYILKTDNNGDTFIVFRKESEKAFSLIETRGF